MDRVDRAEDDGLQVLLLRLRPRSCLGVPRRAPACRDASQAKQPEYGTGSEVDEAVTLFSDRLNDLDEAHRAAIDALEARNKELVEVLQLIAEDVRYIAARSIALDALAKVAGGETV